MSSAQPKFQRLSDLIVNALELAIEQKDVIIAETLARALELSLTRNSGGAGFVERRSMSEQVEAAFRNLDELKKQPGA